MASIFPLKPMVNKVWGMTSHMSIKKKTQTVKLFKFFLKDAHESTLSRDGSILAEIWIFKFSCALTAFPHGWSATIFFQLCEWHLWPFPSKPFNSGLSKSHVCVRHTGLMNLTRGLACFVPSPWACLVTSQPPVVPQKSMTYQSVSTLHGKFISLVISEMKRGINRKKSNQTCRCLKIILLLKLGGGQFISHKKRDLLITPSDLPILL